MSLRTPLSRVRGLGSAKSGTDHWLLQRLTAIANVPLVAFTVGFLIYHQGADRAAVAASLQNPVVAVLLGMAFISVLWHMRLGMQVVVEDYIHQPLAKFTLLILNIFYAAALLVVVLYSILKMSFGS